MASRGSVDRYTTLENSLLKEDDPKEWMDQQLLTSTHEALRFRDELQRADNAAEETATRGICAPDPIMPAAASSMRSMSLQHFDTQSESSSRLLIDSQPSDSLEVQRRAFSECNSYGERLQHEFVDQENHPNTFGARSCLAETNGSEAGPSRAIPLCDSSINQAPPSASFISSERHGASSKSSVERRLAFSSESTQNPSKATSSSSTSRILANDLQLSTGSELGGTNFDSQKTAHPLVESHSSDGDYLQERPSEASSSNYLEEELTLVPASTLKATQATMNILKGFDTPRKPSTRPASPVSSPESPVKPSPIMVDHSQRDAAILNVPSVKSVEQKVELLLEPRVDPLPDAPSQPSVTPIKRKKKSHRSKNTERMDQTAHNMHNNSANTQRETSQAPQGTTTQSPHLIWALVVAFLGSLMLIGFLAMQHQSRQIYFQ